MSYGWDILGVFWKLILYLFVDIGRHVSPSKEKRREYLCKVSVTILGKLFFWAMSLMAGSLSNLSRYGRRLEQSTESV